MKILLFSRDPGGANTVIPLAAPLRGKGYDVHVFGKDTALIKYSDAGLDATDIMVVIDAVTTGTIEEFLRKESPDIVITGTSADDYTEKYLWQAAESLGIPSMAIVDQWANYGLRFSEYTTSGISEYMSERRHVYMPSRIVAMDVYARDEMVADGLPEERVVICGQPYFEAMVQQLPDEANLADVGRSNAPAVEDFVVIFASEPISRTYGNKAADYWGYDERSTLGYLVKSLSAISRKTTRRLVLVLRPHPKEAKDDLADIVNQNADIPWTVDMETPPWTLMRRANLVCGMSSMFLIESVIMGRPTMSIQIGLSRENPFILDRRGILKSVLTEEELCNQLHRIIVDGGYRKPYFEVIKNPVERILSEMENLLCQSLR